VVDYKVPGLSRVNANYQEYTNLEPGIQTIRTQPPLAASPSVYVFPFEYRPNQYAYNMVYTFDRLWHINSVRTRERHHNLALYAVANVFTISTPPPPLVLGTDYTVDHSTGRTIVTIDKQLQSNITRETREDQNIEGMQWFINGYPYCAWQMPGTNAQPTFSAAVTYYYYPSSEIGYLTHDERVAIGGIIETVNTNGNVSTSRYRFDTRLASRFGNTDFDILKGSTDFTLTLRNMSAWRTSYGILPYAWLSVQIPAHVNPNTLSLTDGVTTWTHFEPYGDDNSGKYWVKLGAHTFETPTGTRTKNLTLTCYSTCEAYDVLIQFGQSRLAYPIDPDQGYAPVIAGSITTPCPVSQKILLRAAPPVSPLRLVPLNAPFDCDTLANPGCETYKFCEEHNFGATIFNTQPNPLVDPVFTLQLAKGLEMDSLKAWQLGGEVPIVSITYDPEIEPGDFQASDFRTITITLDTVIAAYSGFTGLDTLGFAFTLKPTCDFANNYMVYMTASAETRCGDFVTETKHTVPIRIEGIGLTSDYNISNFAVSTTVAGELNLSSEDDAGNATVTLNATITLISASTDIQGVYSQQYKYEFKSCNKLKS
jgi:hypothetical protein